MNSFSKCCWRYGRWPAIGCACAEIPNSKSQIPNKLQIPNSKTLYQAFACSPLGLGAWNLFGIWDLEFGIFRRYSCERRFPASLLLGARKIKRRGISEKGSRPRSLLSRNRR
jgi:hypothetical protein